MDIATSPGRRLAYYMATPALVALAITAPHAALASVQPQSAPTLSVLPLKGPLNAPFAVKVFGLKPGATVELSAERVSVDGKAWTSSAVVTANREGEVDLDTQPSTGGTYVGVSPHGLICSTLPVAPQELGGYIADFPTKPGQRSTINAPLDRSPITVRASANGVQIGAVTIGRGFAFGTAGEEVSGESGWRGVYYPPAKGVPIGEPVVVLSGAGGGLFETTAALLASNGHPVLALALYNYQDLPKALLRLPLEHVRDGSRWLAHRAGTQRVAVLGISRGSEAAQLAAAYFPDAFSAVVAEVPSHLVGGALGPGTTSEQPAWTVGGADLQPFAGPKFDEARMAETAKNLPGYQGSVDLLPAFQDPAVEAASGIPYDRIKVPLLVLAAGADGIWPSYVNAEKIRRRMAALGKADRAEIHIYPDAGHGMVAVGRGNALSSFGYSSGLKGYISTGGTPTGNCEASFQAFEATLRFLQRIQRGR